MDVKKFGNYLIAIGVCFLIASSAMFIYWKNVKANSSREFTVLMSDLIKNGSADARSGLDAMYMRDKTWPNKVDYTFYAGIGIFALGLMLRSSAIASSKD